MFEKIIHFSVDHKLMVFIMVAALVIGGIYSMLRIPIDAVPDITNNQVQVVTVSPALAPQEVEQLITFPIEVAVSNIPDVIEIRSISRYGLSVVTVVFKDKVNVLDARQFVKEQIGLAEQEIPEGLGVPELMPITTGLGEIYQYTLQVDSSKRNQYDAMSLRTIQDWIVKRQLSGIPGIIEVSSFGGYLKQYEVAVDPVLLRSFKLSLKDVFLALEVNNQNSGGSYIEKSTNAYYIRTEGRVKTLEDIENIIVDHSGKTPITIRNIAKVGWGSPKRYGAMTKDGLGEAVGGITLMLKGANSSVAISNVKERIDQVQNSLPEGVYIEPYLDRSMLVSRAIGTVKNNLVEGGLIVIFVLILLLGHWRAGLVVASVIPLSMLFAFIMMNIFGVSANLMSLGAIDFGIVIDGAVIIVENVVFLVYTRYIGKTLSKKEMDGVVKDAASGVYKSAAFGVLIILVVFIPVISLTGIEGKMFRPMALTVSFAILGAMILAMTYVPVVISLVMERKVIAHVTLADRFMNRLRAIYKPLITSALKFPAAIISLSLALFVAAALLFRSMGAEFIPTLEEGDLAMQMTIQPGSALTESVKTSSRAEKILMENFPEVKHVVSKIGTAEVPTDPMAIEDADIMIILKEKEEWTSAKTRDELVTQMKEKLNIIVGASFEFTQPIQLRFNELMTGAKTDIAVKIFGENVDELFIQANNASKIISTIQGAGDVKVEQTDGLPQLMVKIDRRKLLQYHLTVEDVNQAVRTAYAGEVAGVVFENEKKFDLVVRLAESYRDQLELNRIFIPLENGSMVPVSELARVDLVEGPMLISREDAKRRIVIGVNVRNRDVASLVNEIQDKLQSGLSLPPGYFITYGGQFENLEAAKKRLQLALPAALLLIFIFLYSAFGSLRDAAIIFTAVPLSAIGGVAALWIRGMPFSISAGVGFIALFGLAVLNGIVLISYFKQQNRLGQQDLGTLVIEGGKRRLRPVLMTASVAALGFLPMALSTSAGAEVQKPLATVVIGGLILEPFLTLFVVPIIYYLMNKKKFQKVLASIILLFLTGQGLTPAQAQKPELAIEGAIESALNNHPDYKNAILATEQSELFRKQSYNPGNLEFGYQQGNINSQAEDWAWEIVQPLGNPVEASRRNTAGHTLVALGMKRQELARREVTRDVSIAWFEWAFAHKKWNTFEAWKQEADTLQYKLDLAQQAGDVTFSEATYIQNLLTLFSQIIVNTRVEYERATTNLYSICQLTDELQPGPIPPIPQIETEETISTVFSSLMSLQRESIDNQINVSKSTFFPSLYVGYFRQQIDEQGGFDGWKAGLAVPVWIKPNSKEVQKWRLESQILDNNQQFYINRYQNELERVLAQASYLLEGLRSQPTEEELTGQFDQVLLARRLGDSGYFETVVLIQMVIENYQRLLELQADYYSTYAQYQFLTD